MWSSIKAMYDGAARFARAAPLLFLVPALVEFAQHVAEVQSGMYLSRDAARAAAAKEAAVLVALLGAAHVQAIMPEHGLTGV